MRKKLNYMVLLASAVLLTACNSDATDSVDATDVQQKMLNLQDQDLLPHRENHSDLYFVGFAADSTQDVFAKEVIYSQQLFDANFDTAGRSISLLNNAQYSDSDPLATTDNLIQSLQQVKNKMDVEEDIVFIFMTGHGTPTNNFVVKNPPYYQYGISPGTLNNIIDNSGIKWKVVVVSACFSGEFVNVLADATTMVMSASDPYQQSFGCTNTADFTYFGEAYFKDSLNATMSFVDAFYLAEDSISIKESGMGFENSNPQIFVSSEMREKLENFQIDFSNNLPE